MCKKQGEEKELSKIRFVESCRIATVAVLLKNCGKLTYRNSELLQAKLQPYSPKSYHLFHKEAGKKLRIQAPLKSG